MKATGIVRRVDDLGRVVIPMELRRTMDIKTDDGLEIFTDNEGQIVFRKYQPGCTFCGGMDDLKEHHGSHVCALCRRELAG